MKRAAVILACLASIASPANANNWEKFFTPMAPPAVPFDTTAGEAIVEPLNPDGTADVLAMWERGYAAIGTSDFNSPSASTKDAIKLATKLKASHVHLTASLVSSTTTSIPITTPTTTTSTTNGNVNVYNNRFGNTTGTYSGTTTTNGSQTTYIPMTVNRYEKHAIYYRPLVRKGTGLLVREMDAQERARYQTNRAVIVGAVRRGSPSYLADVLPGDVIKSIDGSPADVDTWTALKVRFLSGSVESFSLIVRRGDVEKKIDVPVPPEWR